MQELEAPSRALPRFLVQPRRPVELGSTCLRSRLDLVLVKNDGELVLLIALLVLAALSVIATLR